MNVKIYNEYPDEARVVREKVFIEEQGFSYDYDETDDVAVHIVIFENDVPVGACRVFRGENPETFILGRLAVKKECRSRGIGGKVVEAAMEYVMTVGGKCICLHSQMQAKDFYEKLGFCVYGEIEYEEDCPHIWMKLNIDEKR